MPIPDKERAETLEAVRFSQEEGTLFQSGNDFRSQERWVEEQVQRLGAPVWLALSATERRPQGSREAAGVDPLYGDVLDPEFNVDAFDDRKQTRAIVEHEPSRQLLKRYGIDEERDVVFNFPLSLLKALGFITEQRFRGVNIGDFCLWDGTWYMVANVHRRDYFGQTDRPYFTAAFCVRYRLNNVSTVPDIPKR